MSAQVHFILQGKGGVGKSVVARLLIEYLMHKGKAYVAYDADAVNQSLHAVKDYNVKIADLLNGGEVDTRKFDTLIKAILEQEDTSIIVDCGASSFLPILGYMEQADTVEIFTDEGIEVFFHTVVTGGPARSDTYGGYKQISERFSNNAYIVVWQNPYFGQVEENGVKFVDLPTVKKAFKDDKLLGVVQMPVLHRMTQEDFSEFLGKDISFGVALSKESKVFDSLVKRRIGKVHKTFMDQIGLVLVEGGTESEGSDA